MSITPSTVKMSVALQAKLSQPFPSSSSRGGGPALSVRSPLLRIPRLMVALLNPPEEVECLKIRPLVAYTNREVVNYNKVDPRNLITLWDRPCYSSAKERTTDERFWTFFHQDWYHSMLYLKTTPMVKL
jgi:hypothetical protein